MCQSFDYVLKNTWPERGSSVSASSAKLQLEDVRLFETEPFLISAIGLLR